MWSRLVAVIVFLAIAAPAGLSQLMSGSGNLSVRVTTPDGHRFSAPVRVELMESSGSNAIATTFTNDAGMAEFNGVRVGTYHVVVSGDMIESADSGRVELDSRKLSQFVYISVKPKQTEDAASQNGSSAPVAAADLNIPEKASKQFDKGSEYIAKQKWEKAIEQLKKAVETYPKYAQAYNNMAVAYGHLGDRAGQRAALQQAISLNDHLAPAYVNLARMDIVDRNFPEAETLLGHATSADPTDAKAIVLLANVQLLDQHYDDAIANCHKLHSMIQTAHSLAHYIAARAFEHQNRPNDAFSELQTFLKEEPDGPRAEAARKEIGQLQAYLH